MKNLEFENLSALVVEDVPSMRLLLVQLLKEIGFSEVLTGEDGADALKNMENAPLPIDVIVCDLEMPIIGGIEFIKLLRSNSNAIIKDTPVVVVTGHSEKANLYQAVKAGIHGFLVKPVSRKALESGVRHALMNDPIDPAVFNKRTMTQSGKVDIPEKPVGKNENSPEINKKEIDKPQETIIKRIRK